MAKWARLQAEHAVGGRSRSTDRRRRVVGICRPLVAVVVETEALGDNVGELA